MDALCRLCIAFGGIIAARHQVVQRLQSLVLVILHTRSPFLRRAVTHALSMRSGFLVTVTGGSKWTKRRTRLAGRRDMSSQEGLSKDQTVDPGIDEKLETRSIAETLARLDTCSKFRDLVRNAGLEYVLQRTGLHTLFAPNNDAFSSA